MSICATLSLEWVNIAETVRLLSYDLSKVNPTSFSFSSKFSLLRIFTGSKELISEWMATQRREHQIDMKSGSSLHSNAMLRKHNSKKSWLHKRYFKQWQRKFYDFIYSNVGMAITLAFSLLLIYELFGFISYFIQYFWGALTGFQSVNYINSNIAKYYKKLPFCHHCSDINFRDNIRNAPIEHGICHKPMDVVYTWVNGSDIQLQTGLINYCNRFMYYFDLGAIKFNKFLFLSVTNIYIYRGCKIQARIFDQRKLGKKSQLDTTSRYV